MSSIQIRPELKMDVMHWELASSNWTFWFNKLYCYLNYQITLPLFYLPLQQLIFFRARLWSSTVVLICIDNVLIPIFWLLQTRHGGNLLCQIQDKSAVHISTNRSPTDEKCLSVSTAEVPVLLDFGNCIRLPEEQRCLDMCFFYWPNAWCGW